MACEARIVRVLQALEYPGLVDLPPSLGSAAPAAPGAASASSLVDRPHDLAKIVSWIEDRKVRGLAIPDREPLRKPGPGWEAAYFSYLREMGYSDDPTPGSGGGGGGVESGAGREGPAEARDDGRVLRGLSWLVSEAVACDFEDNNGNDYMVAARKFLSTAPPSSQSAVSEEEQSEPAQPSSTHAAGSADTVVGGRENDGGSHEGKGKGDFVELEGFAAGVETGDEACDRVATVLRMLYLSDLRNLQDEVNSVIALAQSSRA